MKKKLIIIGAGGHGKVVADCAEQMQCFSSIEFLDVLVEKQPLCGVWDVTDIPDNYFKYQEDICEFFVAIGNNKIRQDWVKKLQVSAVKIATIIHPTAVISRHSKVGEGSLICAQAVVNPFTHVGIGCILNTASSLDHDCRLDNFVHVAPGSRIAGIVSVGELTFIGIGSSIIQLVKIGKNTIVGAGSTVISDLGDNIVAVGSPAKKIKNNKM